MFRIFSSDFGVVHISLFLSTLLNFYHSSGITLLMNSNVVENLTNKILGKHAGSVFDDLLFLYFAETKSLQVSKSRIILSDLRFEADQSMEDLFSKNAIKATKALEMHFFSGFNFNWNSNVLGKTAKKVFVKVHKMAWSISYVLRDQKTI
jgi:hypothetical protein